MEWDLKKKKHFFCRVNLHGSFRTVAISYQYYHNFFQMYDWKFEEIIGKVELGNMQFPLLFYFKLLNSVIFFSPHTEQKQGQ